MSTILQELDENDYSESLYIAQCKTYELAKDIANNYRNCSKGDEIFNPPFCLRLLKHYRTERVQMFRDRVAKAMWQKRARERKTEDVLTFDSEICPICNGSGEGHHDGSTCRRCGGMGEISLFTDVNYDPF